jgi:pyruvate/2-oxoglutarate dehydrogenase complex dihydrolipoamide dehydrogenase (E3) component
MRQQCDLVVIGAGTAAMNATMRIGSAGWRVAVINFRPFGGTCAFRGCDPKQMLVSGATALDYARAWCRWGYPYRVGKLIAVEKRFCCTNMAQRMSHIKPVFDVGSRPLVCAPWD